MQLDYVAAYHLHCQFTLRSGRTIMLDALDQRMTYSGLIEGVPTAETNDAAINSAIQKARAYCFGDRRPYLIPPTRRDYLREPGEMTSVRWRLGAPEWLPMVRCIASFRDVVTVRDPEKHLSALTVVWYQDEFAFPIGQTVLDQLRLLDWTSLAVDVEF